MPCRDIAKRFDVTEGAIKSIFSGRTWSHLTGADEESQTMNQHVREWISSIMQSPLGIDSIASALDELGYRLAEKCTGRHFDEPNQTAQACL
jgi:hypothetical protein